MRRLIEETLLEYPIIEILIGLVVFSIYFIAWRGLTSIEDCVAKRQLGASTLIGQLTAAIIAATVIFGFLGAFAATLITADNVVHPHIGSHVFYSALLILASIVCCLWGLGAVTSAVAYHDVTKRRGIALPAIMALYLFAASVFRFGLALRALLMGQAAPS